MYVGAIIALNDELDPERFCKAAHQMRELMEKISEITDVEIWAPNERMGEKVAELETEFKAMVENSKLADPGYVISSAKRVEAPPLDGSRHREGSKGSGGHQAR
jgi:hypothetical protein